MKQAKCLTESHHTQPPHSPTIVTTEGGPCRIRTGDQLVMSESL